MAFEVWLGLRRRDWNYPDEIVGDLKRLKIWCLSEDEFRRYLIYVGVVFVSDAVDYLVKENYVKRGEGMIILR